MIGLEPSIHVSGLKSRITSSMLKSRLVFFSVLLIVSHFSGAQNLVPNGSFEQFSVCPGSFSRSAADFKVSGWNSAGAGSPDHFHYCSKGDAGVPYNWAGMSEAYEGDGYAGLYLWMDDNKNYREYLQSKLAVPLVKDSTYYLEFHYKLSSYSNFCIDRIGIALTSHADPVLHDKIIEIPESLSVIRDSALTRFTGIWEAARFEYKARGGETLLTLGNFFSNDDTKSYRLRSRSVSEPMLSHAAYYYVDAVLLIPKYKIRAQLDKNVAPAFTPATASFNTPYVLKNIQFESNSADLESISFDELDMLVEFLSSNGEIKAEISGHTDDVGEAAYNLNLSRKRSEAVSEYLTSRGIDPARVTASGFGESQPLIQGTSVDARRLNRRVEVRFIR
jgi:OOP family OmpA-OmpF porin